MKKDKPNVYHFSVYGKPRPKERARKSKHLKRTKDGKKLYHPFYTPKKTGSYEDTIRKTFLSLYTRLNDADHDWRLVVYVDMRAQRIDLDNLAKVVMDALQKFLYANDRQITELSVYSSFIAKDMKERITIYAEQLGER